MDAEKYPNLTAAMEAVSEHNPTKLPEEVAKLAGADAALAATIDGVCAGMLEVSSAASMLNMARMVKNGEASPALRLVVQARVKVIEGVLELVEALKAEDLVEQNLYLADHPIPTLDVLREYVECVNEAFQEEEVQ